jgi:hypothetical protein
MEKNWLYRFEIVRPNQIARTAAGWKSQVIGMNTGCPEPQVRLSSALGSLGH